MDKPKRIRALAVAVCPEWSDEPYAWLKVG